MINDGKPAADCRKDRMQVRLSKFFKEICLVDQPFVKDGDVTVKQYTENTAKDLGGDIKIVAFARYEKGEGLEKTGR